MYCQKCGAQNDDQAAFCDRCGAALPKVGATPAAGTVAAAGAVQYAGFWRRLAAAIIDGLIMGAVQSVLQVILTSAGVINLDKFMEDLEANPDTVDLGPLMAMFWILGVVMFFVQLLYFAIMESSSKQATLGKMVLGIVVTDYEGRRISFGRALGRNLGKIISQIILFIGYFMIAFTQKKQGLHDMMASTLVVVKR
ncbi:MAG: RDD family protein [Dehalococcoidia bacterium]|nr:RDD family protein [Dehalococcoidia bacterium]